MKNILLVLTWLLLVTAVWSTVSLADVVTFANGDRLTGEVKSLERGKLRFDSAATGTIPVEWDEVVQLTSSQNVQVETVSGERYLGPLTAATRERYIVISGETGSVELEAARIVVMNPIEESRVERIDGNVTAGFNFAKASKVSQVQLGFEIEARGEKRLLGLDLASVMTDSEDNESSQRHSMDLNYRRLWPERWFTGAVVRLVRNDELGLNLRTSIGAGGGRYIRQTNSSIVSLVGGLQLSRENLNSGIENEDTVEAFVTLGWDWFRYDTPELDLSTQLQVIPNLTNTGRVRAEFDVSMKWELIPDLFWELGLYDSYDSEPVVPGAEKNDYGIVTSLGYGF